MIAYEVLRSNLNHWVTGSTQFPNVVRVRKVERSVHIEVMVGCNRARLVADDEPHEIPRSDIAPDMVLMSRARRLLVRVLAVDDGGVTVLVPRVGDTPRSIRTLGWQYFNCTDYKPVEMCHAANF